MNPHEILARIFRARGALAIAFIVPIVLVGIAFFVTPSKYTATAKILVRGGRELQSSTQMVLPTGQNQTQSTLIELVADELEILKSRELAERVVRDDNPKALCARQTPPTELSESDLDLQSDAFLKALTSTQVKGTSIITVAYESCTPQIAEKILSHFLELYQQKHIEAYAQRVSGFLDSQVARLEGDLGAVERKISEYKVAHNLFDPGNERQVALADRQALSKVLGDSRATTTELHQRREEDKRLLASMPEMHALSTESEQSAAYAKARTDLLDLQVQLQQKMATYEPQSPVLQVLRDQIAGLQKIVDDEEKRPQIRANNGRNPMWDETNSDLIKTESELGMTEAKSAAAQIELERVDKRLAEIEDLAPQLDSMLRQRDSIVDTLKTYRDRGSQASIDEDLDREKIVDVRIIESVSANPKRTAPRAITFAEIGLIAGLGCAMVVLAALVGLAQSFAVRESVENTIGVPVLVSIARKPGMLA